MSETTSDSPLLPAPNLEHLQRIDPTLVGWVVQQTEIEANHRRARENRVDGYIFAERIAGIIAGFLVALVGLGAAAYVAVQGHDTVAAVIGGATLIAIVSVLVTRKSGGQQLPPQSQQHKKKR